MSGPRILDIELQHGAAVPYRATVNSAGLDLAAYLTAPLAIMPGMKPILVSTGIAAAMPTECVGLLTLRSGFAMDSGCIMPNAPGIIDADFRGVIHVPLMNLGMHKWVVNPGDRIAQLTVLPMPWLDVFCVDRLDVTERGEGGFGSTGK